MNTGHFSIEIKIITSKKIETNLKIDDFSTDLSLPPRPFRYLTHRLIAYVYTKKTKFTDEELKILWDLKLNIFDHELSSKAESIFIKERGRLFQLGLIRRK